MDIREIRFGDYSAAINLTRGANCISLRNEKYGVRLLREPNYEKLDSVYLYGMPILFPVNRIEGGAFSFNGTEYRLPINEKSTGCFLHGSLHLEEFSVLFESENRIVCHRVADFEHPYLTFGHSFEIIMEYSLSDKGLLHKVTVKNLSERKMPCMIGFHTTFNSDLGGGKTSVLVDIKREFERNMKVYLPTGANPAPDEVTAALSDASFDPRSVPISRHYEAGGNGRMEIMNPERGIKCVYENDEKYKFRLIYNGAADGYICLEPQTCLVNAPNMPMPYEESGFDFVEPYGEKEYVSRIYVEKI